MKKVKRIMKRALSIILSVVMFLTCVPANIQAAPAKTEAECSGDWTDYTSEVTPTYDGEYYNIYEISTAEELAWVANKLNEWDYDSPAIFRLKADIDLSEHYWIPIAKIYNRRFNTYDIFDGNGHTITGMYIGSESSNYSVDNNCGFSDIFAELSRI